MKKLILLSILSAFCISLLAQQEVLKEKPQYVIIIDEKEIVTNERLNELAGNGYVKAMNKGVSEEKRNEFFRKFGDKIGDKEFIVTITLLTEQEREERLTQQKSDENKDKKQVVEPENIFKIQVNDPAGTFTVNMINGSSLNLSDLKGKVILLNFWATWCAPCLMEFYDMPEKILTPFQNENFVFLPVSIGEKQDIVKKKIEKLQADGIDLNSGIDPDLSIFHHFVSKESIPVNILIDQQGIIRYTSVGNSATSLDSLASEIRKLLK